MTPDADRFYELALHYYYEKQRPDLAIEQLEKAIQLEPENPELFSTLAQIFYEQARLKDAERLFRKALELDYSHQRSLKGLGFICQQRGEDEEAIYYYYRCLDVAEDPDAYFNLGILCHQEGRWEDALEHYQRVLPLEPSAAELYENIGSVLANLGRFEEAATNLQRAVQLNPKDSDTHRLLGTIQETLGEIEHARKSYERAVELDPLNSEAQIRLAQLLTGLPDHRKAVQVSLRALEVCETQGNEGGVASAAWELGWNYYRIGQIDKSIKASRKALKFRPDLAPVRFNLGLALLVKGKPDKAREEYEKGMKALTDLNDLKYHAIKDLRSAVDKREPILGASEILKTLERAYETRRKSSRTIE